MPEKLNIEIGKRIKLRRTTLGLSQADVAGRLGITFQQVQKYEKGTNSLSSSRLYDLSILLKVSVSYFFEGIGNDYSAEGETQKISQIDFGSDRESLEIMKVFRKIEDKNLRKKMIEILHALVDIDNINKNQN